MNQQLQTILDIVQQHKNLTDDEKSTLIKAVKKASSDLTISEFKLERTEKVKRTTSILLEETIEELEQKRKAVEAHNRELEIEAALERVRAKAMTMRSSEDLTETVHQLFKEFDSLDTNLLRCGVTRVYETREVELFTYSRNKVSVPVPVLGRATLDGHPVLDDCFKGWLEQKEIHATLEGMNLKSYYKRIKVNFKLPEANENAKQYGYFFYYPEGSLYTFTETPLTENELKVYRRFNTVVSLTYRRYIDLQEAEKRALEATKQASLDRVRGEIASMRSAEDLNRITPIIWQELTNLGVPFFRCGVFIMNEENMNIQVHLSDPYGKSLGLMNLDYTTNEFTKNSVDAWRKNSVFKDHWSKEEFIEWTKSLMDLGKIKTKKGYQGGTDAPESLDLHFVPFSQGMLYVGNLKPLTDDQIGLVKNLSESFSIAYARYEDFVKLEKVKESVETALTNLKATQSQLIQSEKMASLGELTAGIAHEIQNPLNFVNNFSEVSNELIDEMNEEIEKGDFEEAKAISLDIKQNLAKINQHGKRAEGIVKGMLQHSRSSSGTKELTNINQLADEYLRLAYHGLRAKDKSFNATMVTDFDESIGNIEIIPQDIGRVILNLITNAFYVVDKKKKSGIENYEPTVTVGTNKGDSTNEIQVTDNGNGIPQEILNKIFQPFFTTKPTGQGTGLGLSMSYDIVKAHGGNIKVNTKENEGTEFIISLPTKNNV